MKVILDLCEMVCLQKTNCLNATKMQQRYGLYTTKPNILPIYNATLNIICPFKESNRIYMSIIQGKLHCSN